MPARGHSLHRSRRTLIQARSPTIPGKLPDLISTVCVVLRSPLFTRVALEPPHPRLAENRPPRRIGPGRRRRRERLHSVAVSASLRACYAGCGYFFLVERDLNYHAVEYGSFERRLGVPVVYLSSLYICEMSHRFEERVSVCLVMYNQLRNNVKG